MEICIQNLGMYNEGTLLFKWLELPASEEEIKKALDEIKICHDDVMYYNDCGCPYEEYMLADWDMGILKNEVGEYSNIEELNEKAEFVDNLSSEEEEIFEALLESEGDFETAQKRFEDGDYSYYKAYNDEDLGYEIIDSYGGIECLDKKTLERYFDYEAFGRDASFNMTQTNNGYIELY